MSARSRLSRATRFLGLTGWVVFALAAGGGAATAQDRRPRSEQDRAEMERRVRAQMQRLVKERLELTDEESDALSAVIGRFEDRRRELGRSERAARRRVEELERAGAADDAEARELLATLVDLRRREAELFADEQAALLEVLPAAKVLQLQSLREEMGRRIRNLRRGGERGRRPGGGDHAHRSRPGAGNVDGIQGVDLSSFGPI